MFVSGFLPGRNRFVFANTGIAAYILTILFQFNVKKLYHCVQNICGPTKKQKEYKIHKCMRKLQVNTRIAINQERGFQIPFCYPCTPFLK